MAGIDQDQGNVMNTESAQVRLSSLVILLIELADEIDEVADFGMTVCINEEANMAGRHSYIIQQCEKIQGIVGSIISSLDALRPTALKQHSALQSELAAGSALLLGGFVSLEQFRRLSLELIRSSTDEVRMGWEKLHQVIGAIAAALGLLDQAWYVSILERQDSYRTQLGHINACFHESATRFPTPQDFQLRSELPRSQGVGVP